MDAERLFSVWQIKQRLDFMRRKLNELRNVALTPKLLDNMPRSQSRTSPTERHAIRITELETIINRLATEYIDAQLELISELISANLPKREEYVMLCRYAMCLDFEKIAQWMYCTPEHVGKLHAKALTKLGIDSENN